MNAQTLIMRAANKASRTVRDFAARGGVSIPVTYRIARELVASGVLQPDMPVRQGKRGRLSETFSLTSRGRLRLKTLLKTRRKRS